MGLASDFPLTTPPGTGPFPARGGAAPGVTRPSPRPSGPHVAAPTCGVTTFRFRSNFCPGDRRPGGGGERQGRALGPTATAAPQRPAPPTPSGSHHAGGRTRRRLPVPLPPCSGLVPLSSERAATRRRRRHPPLAAAPTPPRPATCTRDAAPLPATAARRGPARPALPSATHRTAPPLPADRAPPPPPRRPIPLRRARCAPLGSAALRSPPVPGRGSGPSP